MKILYVYGDDYAALEFENADMDLKQIYDEADGGQIVVQEHEPKIIAQAIEFGDVDLEFIKFVKDNLIDYTFAKDRNFYIVE